MSKAAELAALISSQSALSHRNLIINGAMQVAQRGTSVTGITSGAYRTCDRMLFSVTSAGTWTATQSTDSPNDFSNSFRIDCTTAKASLDASNFLILETKIEGQNVQHLMYGNSTAKSITASFYVKSNKTGTYVLEMRQPDSSRLYNKAYTIDVANTWEYKTLTFPGDVSGTINNDNGEGLNMDFWLAAGSNFTSGSLGTSWHTTAANRAAGQVNLADSTDNDWSITGIQLEIGEQATPFEHRSFADELVRCQRYYQAHGNGLNGLSFSIADMPASVAVDTGNITGKSFVKMMRAAPTMVIYSRNSTANKVSLVATGADQATSTFAPNVIGVTGFHVVSRSGGSNLTAGEGIEYGYTADAEL